MIAITHKHTHSTNVNLKWICEKSTYVWSIPCHRLIVSNVHCIAPPIILPYRIQYARPIEEYFLPFFLSCVHIAYLSLTILIDRNTKVCLYSDNNDSPLNLVRLNHTKKNYVKPNQNNMQKRNKNHSHAASFFLVSSQHENHRNLFCIYTIHYWSLSFISFRFQFVFDLFCFTSLDFSQVRCDHWYAIEFYNDTRIVI